MRYVSDTNNICLTDPQYPSSGSNGTCNGDSGAPAYTWDGSTMSVHGVFSFQSPFSPCGTAGVTSFFTNTVPFRDMLLEAQALDFDSWFQIA